LDDGCDAGFAGKYDKDRAQECKDIPGDQYNALGVMVAKVQDTTAR